MSDWKEHYNYLLTRQEQDVIEETMAHHDLTAEQQVEAKKQILAVAKKGGRFYAYMTTHNVCARVARGQKFE